MRAASLLLVGLLSAVGSQELLGSVSSRCPAGCRCLPVRAKANATQTRTQESARPGRARVSPPSVAAGSVSVGTRVRCGDVAGQVAALAELDPSLFPRDTLQLDLAGNLISDVARGSLAHLPLLQKLDLHTNMITMLAPESFLNLTSLRRLDLSGNRLTKLSGGVFLGLEKLTHLRLAQNQLTSIAEGTFDDLISLKNLDLSGNPLLCDCHLAWLVDWLGNESVKLTEGSQCHNPPHLQGQELSGLASASLMCRATPAIPLPTSLEMHPESDQVVFERDSLRLSCVLIGPRTISPVSWLWQSHKDPTLAFSDIRVDTRFLPDQSATLSTLSIGQLTSEHSGQWECRAANLSLSVALLVISSSTQFCPQTVTTGSKGSYTWPRSVVGTVVELPCASSPPAVAAATLARPGLVKPGAVAVVKQGGSARASQLCGQSGAWQSPNTSACAFLSDTTKALEQFAKLSLSKATALQSAQRLRNFTGDLAQLRDKMDVVFLARTIENHIEFITKEKGLGGLLVGMVGQALLLPAPLLGEAQVEDASCNKLVQAAEAVAEHSPAPHTQPGVAVEALRVTREGFQGVTCVWYQDPAGKQPRLFHCSSSALPSAAALHDMEVVASVQVPASLFMQLPGAKPSPQLMVSMFTNARLFPETNASETWGVTSCVVGCRLVGGEGEGRDDALASAPVWVTLRAPLDSLARPVVWDGRGAWSEQGCSLSRMLGSLLVFQCSRLGYFALRQDLTPPLLAPLGPPALASRPSPPALYAGCLLAGSCLLTALVTYVACRRELHMSAKTKHSLANTWLAMLLLSLVFSCGIHQTGDVHVCQGVGLALHYLSLCCLLWMTVTISNLHKHLTAGDSTGAEEEEEVGELPVPPQPMLGFYLVGWGIALIICGISGAVNMRHYAGPSYCFLGPAASVSAVLVPAGAILAVLTLLWLLARCAAARKTSESGRISQGTQATERVDLELLGPRAPSPCLSSSSSSCSSLEDLERSASSQLLAHLAVLTLFLGAWASGAAAVVPPVLPHQATVFSCLYAALSALLGLLVLLYFCATRKDVGAEWKTLKYPRDWWCSGPGRGHSAGGVHSALPGPVPVPTLVVAAPMSYASLPRSHMSAPPPAKVASETEPTLASKTSLDDEERDEAELLEKVCNLRCLVMPAASVVTEGSVSGMDVFYNPHQLGVARKFFRRQRLMKRNNAAATATSCAATSDGESLFSAGSKVNNTNFHHPGQTKLNNRVNRDPNLLANPADFTTTRNVFVSARAHSPVSSISEARQVRSHRPPPRARSADDLGEREAADAKPRQPGQRQRARRRHRRGARRVHESSLASVTNLREPGKLSLAVQGDMYDSDTKKETCV